MPNHSNKQKTTSSSDVNFSASHDQARLSNEMSKQNKEFKKIPKALEEIKSSLQEISPEVKTLAEQQELCNEIAEKQTAAIKLVKYAQQVVENLHKTANKLNAIVQKSPDDKLKTAQSLLTADKPLNQEERYRFKKIEQALSNTCIIKSAGDETLNFQLGVLGNARENNLISESEFNHLVILRLKENNLLDEYRLRIEGDMILEQTPLGICQAIDINLLLDADYNGSKSHFLQRLKGIGYELSLEKLNNDYKMRGYEKRDSLWNELAVLNESAKTQVDLEGKPLNLPEVEMTDPSNEANLELVKQEMLRKLNIIKEREKIDLQFDTKRSKFVELMEKLIPENSSKAIVIDTIKPTPIEAIMRITLERPSPVSDKEALRINFANNRAQLKSHSIADEKYLKILADPSSSNNGDAIHKETLSESKKSLTQRDQKRKETKPCQLTGEDLVNEYREVILSRLQSSQASIERQITDLENKYNKRSDEFSRLNLDQKHGNASSFEKKQIRTRMFREEKRKLNGQLEEAKQHLAL